MTPKRRDAILASLKAGSWIYQSWSGSNRNGRCVYRLDGVERLREAEVTELRREGVIRVMKPGEVTPCGRPYLHFSLKPYRLAEEPKS